MVVPLCTCGPELGSLTLGLLDVGAKVEAVEIDKYLVPALREMGDSCDLVRQSFERSDKQLVRLAPLLGTNSNQSAVSEGSCVSSSGQQIQLEAGLTTLLGGARSGKSDLAVEIACQWSREVVFVATAEPHDENMKRRIAKHKVERPSTWSTIENPQFGAPDLDSIQNGALVVVDCLTVLVSNFMLNGLSEAAILKRVGQLAEHLSSRPAPGIVVTNEVGLGVHPATELGAEYRDTLGKVNILMAEHSNAVLLVFAGRVLPLADVSIQL